MFHHVVTFRLKDAARIEETAAKLRAMAGKVPALRSIEVGVDELKGGRSVHIALITRFDDREGYDAYAADPVHRQVLAHMATVVESASVVDWSDEGSV
jgi:antibiotic biosynthesis monooxygenase (ABM) superfamily enzyme